MKKMMLISVIISAFMLLMPLAVLWKVKKTETTVAQTVAPIEEKAESSDVFRVLDKTTNKITKMTADDYIFGVVVAEMPALYETEALKAQAVAAYTYFSRAREQVRKKDNTGKTPDFTVNTSQWKKDLK